MDKLVSLARLLILATLVNSKCLVREPSDIASSPHHDDAGFGLSINGDPEFYEEQNLYTITLKVRPN